MYKLGRPSAYRGGFKGSDRLFRACWGDYRRWLRNGAMGLPQEMMEVRHWLDAIASDKVNNSRSRFYIYG